MGKPIFKPKNMTVEEKRTFVSFGAMHYRCARVKGDHFHQYKARGITICNEWSKTLEGFNSFVAAMGYRPEALSLDRIDNDKGYFAGNCRWATLEMQRRNRRPVSDKAKQNYRNSKLKEKNPNYGKSPSLETKRKQSIARKAYWAKINSVQSRENIV